MTKSAKEWVNQNSQSGAFDRVSSIAEAVALVKEIQDDARVVDGVKIKTIVTACLEDVRYLLAIQSCLHDLDSSVIFEAIKDNLRHEFNDNIRSIIND